MEYTLGIEGGPRDGQVLTVEPEADGIPPHLISLDGAWYVRIPVGIPPHDERWHYCHRPPGRAV
ncbi:hypothetical protein U9R90_05225 [Streptomyces sp. E11-3]|uniref:hypothetical protein n=1 Tax=Streptomyces sp. E11-3 TaxID=3110112 RepID=UPI00397EF506